MREDFGTETDRDPDEVTVREAPATATDRDPDGLTTRDESRTLAILIG
jgi:hypothetical protein